MKVYEQILDLMLGFTVARARSVLLFCAVVLVIAWLIDWRTEYSDYSRLERAVSLAERLDALERRGATSKELSELRANLLERLQNLNARDQPGGSELTPPPPLWVSQWWTKALAGALPWFLISCFAIPGLLRLEGSSWAGFLAFQFITTVFGLLNAAIPSTGRWLIDLALVPLSFFAVFGLAPLIAATAIPAFKKVRDSSKRKAIQNNLRQLSSAADMYFLQNGVSRVESMQLIGPEPEKYLKHLLIVDGERYDDLVIEQGKPISVKRSSGEVISITS